MIICDSNSQKREKYTDYIPEKQKQRIFQHLSSCSICSDRIESYRLSEISKEMEFNEIRIDKIKQEVLSELKKQSQKKNRRKKEVK